LIYIIHPPILVGTALAWRHIAAPALVKFIVTGSGRLRDLLFGGRPRSPHPGRSADCLIAHVKNHKLLNGIADGNTIAVNSRNNRFHNRSHARAALFRSPPQRKP
jgi:hypothetical protein